MTDPEKDREAVEWAVRAAESAATPPYPSDGIATLGVEYMRVVAALAREALAMRERGVVGWAVRSPDGSIARSEWGRGNTLVFDSALEARDSCVYLADRIVPLYAGQPVEVGDE